MPHPALHQTTRIAPDIFPPVFDWFFTDPAFKRWRDVKVLWQLHCIGQPGVGKTTLTALVHRHLEEHFQPQNSPVVPVYIAEDVQDHENHFIEDLLVLLYRTLGHPTAPEHDESVDVYLKYESGRESREPPGMRDRLRRLREAIRLRLHALRTARAFLLLDGIDRCGPTIRMMLDEELARFLEMGLSILVTSRLSDLEDEDIMCDHKDHAVQPSHPSPPLHYQYKLDVFLECNLCNKSLCFTCRSQNRHCPNDHEDSNLLEPYHHVNINIAVPPEALRDFIAWNLETEHGELGLGSSAKKPPLSNLGKSLCSNTANQSAQEHADKVYRHADGHIGLAKARLDFIHTKTSLDAVEAKLDQLPDNIVTIFDSGLEHMKDQPVGRGTIAVRAIAAASFEAHGDARPAIPSIRAMLRSMDDIETRSGEDIIEATRGFLLASNDEPRQLMAFHSSFLYYIGQRYNKTVHRASMEIKIRRPRLGSQDMPELASDMSPNKLVQSPPMQATEEEPFRRFIVRKGTQAWQ